MPQKRERDEKPKDERPEERSMKGATPEQKAAQKAREDAQKQKQRRIKDAAQQYINYVISLGLNPGDYRKVIEQAAKNGWGRETFIKRAGLETQVVATEEEEGFLQQVLGDYTELHGAPPSKDIIAQLQGMGAGTLAAYAKNLRTQLEAKSKAMQTQQSYHSQLASVYLEITGEMPPPGFVEKRAQEGMDMFEFEWELTHRPEYEKTPGYFNRGQSLAAEVAQGLGLM